MTAPKHVEAGTLMSGAVVHGGIVYLSGQVALSAAGADFETQAQEVFARIDALLEKAGSNRAQLLSATIWLTELEDFAQFNALWQAWLDGAPPPARATTRADLMLPGLKLEVQVTAVTD